ncbi:MAG: hypothetical protein J6Z42_02270, partial [Lachnospiraceae bacterium]|nr:hypothetical protein [Lachnospiraceae bacterium]
DAGPGMDGISQVAYIPNPLANAESETIEEALYGQKAEENEREKKEIKTEETTEETIEEIKEEKTDPTKEIETIVEKSVEDEENEDWSEDSELKKEEEKKREKEEKKRLKEEKEKKEEEERNQRLEKQKQIDHERALAEGLEEYAEYKAKLKEYEQKAPEREERLREQNRIIAERQEREKDSREVREKISGLYKDKSKKQKKTDRKAIAGYEKKHKDYNAFGIGFSLDQVNITAADSKYMRNVKLALEEYLTLRREIFEAHKFSEDYVKNKFRTPEGRKLIHDGEILDEFALPLSETERQRLGDAYETAIAAIGDYRRSHNAHIAFGRGRARFRQVRLIEERLTMDNARMYLSSARRDILRSVDMKYEKRDSARKNIMPTWHRFIILKDSINIKNQRYRNERRRQKAEGKLPPWYKRALSWTGLGMINNVKRLVMAYEGIGGLVDRGIGLATMIAANSLTFAGKIVKTPLKILSVIFNGASKYVFKSKKRWKVDYSLTEGWKNVDDGRRIFRKYLKGALVLPAAVTETFTRGIPYIFGHQFKSGVYKRTGKWSKAIFDDVKDVMKGIGIKDYGIEDRADADYAMAGGISADKEGNVYFTKGTEDEDSLTIEKTDTETANKEKDKKISKKKTKKAADVSDREYTKDDLKELMQRQDRMVADLNEYDKKNKEHADMLRQGDVREAESEIDEIDKVLDMYANDRLTGNIQKEDIDVKALKFKRARDILQLLVNEHSKKDSPEMKNAKIDVVKLSLALEDMKNQPATIESVGDIAAYYEIALASLKVYLDTKKKNKRYDRVQAAWESLAFERDILSIYLQDPKEMKGTIGDILHMTAGKKGDIERTRADVKYGPFALSDDAAYARKLFGAEYQFSDVYLKPGIKAGDRKKEAAKVLALRKELSEFKPGKVQIRKLNVLGKDITILQKADNRLYVLDGHEQIPLNKNALLMCSQIEREIMMHSDSFGGAEVASLMDKYKGTEGNMTSGEHMRIRANLIEFLSSKLKVQGDAFTNVRRTTMITYAEWLIKGEKTADDIKKLMSTSKADQDMINGIELTELMELDAVRQEEINSHVSMYEIMAEKYDNDWSEEEKDVKNLLADFIFSADTLIMDKYADNPEEYIRTVLLQNKKAVAVLMKEDKTDIIASVFAKMSLEGVKGVGDDDLHATIAKAVKNIIKQISSTTGTDGTADELEEKIDTYLNNTQDKVLTGKLKAANTEMEQAINKSCDILQENVNQIVDLMLEKTEKGKNTTLQDIIKGAAKGEEGQGKFTRQVLTNYFSKMSVIDKRSMLSSVIRSSRKVEESKYSDRELYDEIRSRRLSAYPQLLKKPEGFELDKLTKAEKAQIEEYREKKRKMKVGANYFGGLIMGAGPLFQKMMQGLPEDELPEEVRMALSDVKSNLTPIPARVVKSQFNAMIEKSQGMITKIEVLKNLGAATVGQTFRCRIYGPTLPKEGKNVVIKLLRADVQNRMKRESKVMLDCAKATDEGMYETYKGQLGIYEKELDFSVEANNIKEGEIYNGRFNEVVSESINGIIDTTVNTLVLEEAPGATLVDILLDAQRVRKDVRYDLSVKGKLNGKDHIYDYIRYEKGSVDKVIAGKNKLLDKVSDLIKKRDILANMCNVWVDEALFKSGYYHADLHAGNMLISDSKLTMIDFGNAVKFNEKQQTSITQMMTAAAAGSVDMFFSAFNLLLDMKDEKFAEFYNEKKQAEVKAAFDEILNMGSDEETGERISAALIRAQELGVKLPPAIYNFSQGQLRLQKSINDINKMISDIKEDISWIEKMQNAQNNFDAISIAQNRVIKTNRKDRDVVFKNYVDLFEIVKKEDFVKGILDNTKKKANLEKGIAEVDKRKDFNEKVLGTLFNVEEQIDEGETSLEEMLGYRAVWEDYKAKWKDKVGTKEQIAAARKITSDLSPINAGDPVFDLFGGKDFLWEIGEAVENFDEERVNEILAVYDDLIPAAIELEKKVKELYRLQDAKKLTEEQKEKLTDEIYDSYNRIRQNQIKNNPLSRAFKSQ